MVTSDSGRYSPLGDAAAPPTTRTGADGPGDGDRDIVDVEGDRLVAGGDCLVRRHGEPVLFVRGLLPGERALVRIEEARRDYARGSVLQLLAASGDRTDPPCARVADGCGGCDWQHLEPGAQHREKRSIVVDALRRGARLADAESLVSMGSAIDPSGYRTTVRAAVDERGRAGFHRVGTHRVVPSEACLVAHPRVSEVLETGRFPGATEVRIRVSEATGEVVVATTPGECHVHTPDHVVVADDSHCLSETVAGVELRVSMGSFFQSSPSAAGLLIDAVALALSTPTARHADDSGEESVLVDLYGGVGLFACTLGSAYAAVIVVENEPTAVADARVNVARHAKGVVVDADVDRWRPGSRIAGRPTVIADPSRAGLGKAGVGTIAALDPESVVLVSCDAAALGRDVRLLGEVGWNLHHTVVLDLFPHSHHLEAVSRFVRPPG